ncbi:hypothetical protein C6P40_003240 [Pichia californica]|uniref:RNA exonuclease 3 n=1 Tax=Pichia californica TaxID=460514 RepID=A0A9P7BGP5_9ASCO|nr:hypothetical protein C6P42_004300 [[Candida] californica]KAG0690316.1 hypothetical protein C6P40_003240 [[Candida] californica]
MSEHSIDPVIEENDDDNSVHHHVARLSISVADEESNNERQKFLLTLRNQQNSSSNETLEGGGDGGADNDSDTSKELSKKEKSKKKNEMRRLKKRLKKQEILLNKVADLESAIAETDDSITTVPTKNSRGSKRRRSSVAQNVIVRKKKFLEAQPKFTVLGDLMKKATISSIRDLMLYSLTDMELKPRWCKLDNRRSVDKCVVVFLRGLTNKEFGMPPLKYTVDPLLISKYELNPYLNSFGDIFKEVIPMTSPGSNKCIYSTYSSLVSYTLSKKQKSSIQKENENRKIVLPDLYLKLDDLLFNNYPIHKDVEGATQEMINRTSDYKSTTDFNHEGSKTFALDCEMCRSEHDRVLARVSLTDFENNVIIDELIIPSAPIIDYLTQWSGITEEKIAQATTTVEEIQEKILSIVSSNDTLIGHSLESDLNILKLKHPKIVDTSICFDHPRGPPSKASLKMLMSSHLDTSIQMNFTGHDSVEDCISCMELVKLKIAKGYLFGKSYTMESIFKRISQNYKLIKKADGEKIPKSSVVIGYSAVKNFGHHEEQIQCQSDDEVIDKFIETQEKNDLIILKLRELEWFKGYSPNNLVESMELPADKNTMYEKVNERLMRIYENLAPNSILVVCSENGDTTEMLRLQELSKTFKYKVEKGENNIDIHVKDVSWTEETSEKLTQAIDVARDTLFLCALKPSRASSVTPEPSNSDES